jgi:DNA topoisomerase-1
MPSDLLRLPRLLGEHPEAARSRLAGPLWPLCGVGQGQGREGLSLPQGEDDVLMVGLSRALELLAMPKRGRGGRTALKDLGKPEGSEETIQVFDGPYGLYVKQGKVNASLPEGKGADDITLPRPYRITIRLAAADPAAPAESVTDALRRAGIGFEVETIEKIPSLQTSKKAASDSPGQP